jgi:hypothetical protein
MFGHKARAHVRAIQDLIDSVCPGIPPSDDVSMRVARALGRQASRIMELEQERDALRRKYEPQRERVVHLDRGYTSVQPTGIARAPEVMQPPEPFFGVNSIAEELRMPSGRGGEFNGGGASGDRGNEPTISRDAEPSRSISSSVSENVSTASDSSSTTSSPSSD